MEEKVEVEDGLQALVKELMDPVLANLNPYVDVSSREHDIARQMEAIAWLYDCFICKDFPYLEHLDWLDICKKTVILRAKLMKCMGSLKEGSDATTMTEKKVKNACDAAASLKNHSPDNENFAISKVCVCVVNSSQEKCLLLFGSITLGAWSFFEKDVDSHNLSIEEENISEKVRNKKKSSCPWLLELAFKAVSEHTGVQETNLIVESETSVNHCMSKVCGSTQLFIMSCQESALSVTPTTSVKLKWVSLQEVLSRGNGPLLNKTAWGTKATSSLEYFHLRPFCRSIHNWMLCKQTEKVAKNVNRFICDKETEGNTELTSLKQRNISSNNASSPNQSKQTEKVAKNVNGLICEKEKEGNTQLTSLKQRNASNNNASCPNRSKQTEKVTKNVNGLIYEKEVEGKTELASLKQRNISNNNTSSPNLSNQTEKVAKNVNRLIYEKEKEGKTELTSLKQRNASNNNASSPNQSKQTEQGARNVNRLICEKEKEGNAELASLNQRNVSNNNGNSPHLDGQNLSDVANKGIPALKDQKAVYLLDDTRVSIQGMDVHVTKRKADDTETTSACNGLKRHMFPLNDLRKGLSDPTASAEAAKISLINDIKLKETEAQKNSLLSSSEDGFKQLSILEVGPTHQVPSELVSDALHQNGSKKEKSNKKKTKKRKAASSSHKDSMRRKAKKVVNLKFTPDIARSTNAVQATKETCCNGKAVDMEARECSLQKYRERRQLLQNKLIAVISKYQLQADFLMKQIAQCDKEFIACHGGDIADHTSQKSITGGNSLTECREHMQEGGPTRKSEDCGNKQIHIQIGVDQTGASLKLLRETCLKNQWSSPMYSILATTQTKSEVLYVAKVRVNGPGFELCESGSKCGTEKEAKASAAKNMMNCLDDLILEGGI